MIQNRIGMNFWNNQSILFIYLYYQQILKLLALDPHQNQSQIETLLSVINFISQVCHKYPRRRREELIDILQNHGNGLDS